MTYHGQCRGKRTPVAGSVQFPVLKTGPGLLLSEERDDSEAALRDFDHPHDVHHVQNNAGQHPGALDLQPEPRVGLGPQHGVDEGVEERHGGDPHREEHHGHEDAVDDVGLGKPGILQSFKEPPGEMLETTRSLCISEG